MKNIIVILFMILTGHLYSQEQELSGIAELKADFEAIYSQSDDQSKKAQSAAFVDKFKHILYQKGAFDYHFNQLQMGKMTSPDKRFRLFNWNVDLEDGKEKYYALIVIPKGDKVSIIELHDAEEEVRNVEQAVLSNKKWMGALYYKIVPVKRRGRTIYLLLGWDGYSMTTNRKVIEVMTINGKNIRFGSPIFKKNKKTLKRILFEYAEDAVMSLKYQPKKKRIVFDHLAPVGNHINAEKEFYAPDLTFDAYEIKKGKLFFIDNLEFLRPNTKKDREFNDPREN